MITFLKMMAAKLFQYVLYPFYFYSGIGYVWAKARTDKDERNYPTLCIWLAGFYVGLFGVSLSYYESRLSRYENKLNTYVSLIGTSAGSAVYPALVKLQHQTLPQEPVFWNFHSAFRTLFIADGRVDIEEAHLDQLNNVSALIVLFKRNLVKDRIKKNGSWVNLDGIHLKEADLIGAEFGNVLLKGAHLEGTKLQLADLVDADLQGANLKDADLTQAKLNGADLQGTNLLSVSGIDCDILKATHNWQKAIRDKNLGCGVKIPSSCDIDPQLSRITYAFAGSKQDFTAAHCAHQ